MPTRGTLNYLVCATPRSGSTLLCETLRATSVAGRPLEHFEVLRHSGQPPQPREYFAGAADRSVLQLLAPLDPPDPDPEPPADWWARIRREGATANGVWGGKLMWGHVPELLARARGLPEVGQDAQLDDVLDMLLGDDLRLLYVTREDKIAQAVSLWRAVQTQNWRAGHRPGPGEAQYAFAGIDHLRAQLVAHDAAWNAWFHTTGRRPHTIVYESMAADPGGVIANALAFLGLPETAAPAPATLRQGDALSEEWARRYRAERAAAA
jgi:LPS sulfotransferase NodH